MRVNRMLHVTRRKHGQLTKLLYSKRESKVVKDFDFVVAYGPLDVLRKAGDLLMNTR